jgi:hypothetical protein
MRLHPSLQSSILTLSVSVIAGGEAGLLLSGLLELRPLPRRAQPADLLS